MQTALHAGFGVRGLDAIVLGFGFEFLAFLYFGFDVRLQQLGGLGLVFVGALLCCLGTDAE